MRDKVKALEAAGSKVLVIDPHERYRAGHFHQRAGLAFDFSPVTVLADPAHTVSATYGVAFQMQIHTEWSNRPATFIVDKKGVLRYARRGKKYSDRPKPPELIDELSRLR